MCLFRFVIISLGISVFHCCGKICHTWSSWGQPLNNLIILIISWRRKRWLLGKSRLFAGWALRSRWLGRNYQYTHLGCQQNPTLGILEPRICFFGDCWTEVILSFKMKHEHFSFCIHLFIILFFLYVHLFIYLSEWLQTYVGLHVNL